MRIEDSECRVAEGREKSELETVEDRLSVMLLAIWRFRGGKLGDYADVCNNGKAIHLVSGGPTRTCAVAYLQSTAFISITVSKDTEIDAFKGG